MRSKNLSFKLSWPLIRKDLTRFWPVWGSYLAIWLMILPIPMLTSYSGTEAYPDLVNSIHRLLTRTGGEASLVMTALYGGLSAFAVWSYLYQSRSASLFHALPVTRETLFCSHFTAGLSFLVIPNVLIALLTYLCQMSLGYFDPTQILCWLAVTCLESLLFYALGTLAAMCTGSLPTMPVLYGLINFAVVVYESLLTEFSTQLYWGVSSQSLKLTFLSPFIHLAQTSCYVNENISVPGSTYPTWQTISFYDPEFLVLLCLYALAAVVLAVCSLLLYRRRATESAGDVIAFGFLKPIAKYCFAFGCALVLGWIFEEVLFPSATDVATRILCCCLGGAIGYITAVMLLKKSFRVFQLKKMTGLLVLWVVIVGLFLAFDADLFGVESKVPRLGEVTEATIYSDYDLQLTQPQDIDKVLELHRTILENKDELDTYPSAYNSVPYDWDSCYVRINYYYEDGTTLRRSYNLPCGEKDLADPDSPASKLSAIMSEPQRLVESYLPPEDAVIESIQLHLYDDYIRQIAGEPFNSKYTNNAYLDSAHFDLLLNAMEEDIRAGRLCAWNERNITQTYDTVFTVEISYDHPVNNTNAQTVTVLENAEIYHTVAVDYETKMASEWKHIEVCSFDDPKSTMNLLVQLGYLTAVPSVLDTEVPNG